MLVEEKELEKVAPSSARTMEILEFVKLAGVDPIYFDTSYYGVPEEARRKAYYLLVRTMEKAGYAAIARVTTHQREYTVVIRPKDNGLTLHTMYYPNEIREVAEYGQTDAIEVREQEVKLAEQLVLSLAAEFEPAKYRDEYQDRLRAIIDAKLAGREVAEAPRPHLAPVIDLMEALKKSLAQQQAVPKKPPARAVAPAVEKVVEKRARKKP